jgi:hypothetical protein
LGTDTGAPQLLPTFEQFLSDSFRHPPNTGVHQLPPTLGPGYKRRPDKEALLNAWGFQPMVMPSAQSTGPSVPSAGPSAPSAGPSAPFAELAPTVQVPEKSVKRPAPPVDHPVYANNYGEVPIVHHVQPTITLSAQAPEMLPRGLPEAAHPIYDDYSVVPHIPQLMQSLDPLPSRAEDLFNNTIPVNMRDLQDDIPPIAKIVEPFGSQVGRPSDEVLEVLNKAFSDLNSRVKKLAQETGLSVESILTCWNLQTNRAKNAWNMYQQYFKANQVEELAHIGVKIDGSFEILQRMKSECMAKFKEEHGDTWEEILRVSNQLEELEGKGTTMLTRLQ